MDQLRSGVRRPTTRLVRTPKPARNVTVPAEYASPAKSIGRIRKYEIGLRTPPSRTAPTAMKTNVKAAQEVKNSLDQRVSTRRRPSSRNGPMEAIRLSPLSDHHRLPVRARRGQRVAQDGGGAHAVGEDADVDVTPPELGHVGGHVECWELTHAWFLGPLVESSLLSAISQRMLRRNSGRGADTQVEPAARGPVSQRASAPAGGARCRRSPASRRAPWSRGRRGRSPGRCPRSAAARRWGRANRRRRSRAMRMLEAGTGFSTPRNVTWVSERTSPQLGRSPMTAGAASASPAAARSHRRDGDVDAVARRSRLPP